MWMRAADDLGERLLVDGTLERDFGGDLTVVDQSLEIRVQRLHPVSIARPDGVRHGVELPLANEGAYEGCGHQNVVSHDATLRVIAAEQMLNHDRREATGQETAHTSLCASFEEPEDAMKGGDDATRRHVREDEH